MSSDVSLCHNQQKSNIFNNFTKRIYLREATDNDEPLSIQISNFPLLIVILPYSRSDKNTLTYSHKDFTCKGQFMYRPISYIYRSPNKRITDIFRKRDCHFLKVTFCKHKVSPCKQAHIPRLGKAELGLPSGSRQYGGIVGGPQSILSDGRPRPPVSIVTLRVRPDVTCSLVHHNLVLTGCLQDGTNSVGL